MSNTAPLFAVLSLSSKSWLRMYDDAIYLFLVSLDALASDFCSAFSLSLRSSSSSSRVPPPPPPAPPPPPPSLPPPPLPLPTSHPGQDSLSPSLPSCSVSYSPSLPSVAAATAAAAVSHCIAPLSPNHRPIPVEAMFAETAHSVLWHCAPTQGATHMGDTTPSPCNSAAAGQHHTRTSGPRYVLGGGKISIQAQLTNILIN